MADRGLKWITFLRKYGPIACNDNMYDEHIRRSAKWAGFQPFEFEHPYEEEVKSCFRRDADRVTSVVLTGTAGDGKSHLCGRIWRFLGGDEAEWMSDSIYYKIDAVIVGKPVTVHVIRDLTALPDTDDGGNYATKDELLRLASRAVREEDPRDVFLIAGNDGQLLEEWHRLPPDEDTSAVGLATEEMLVEDLQESPDVGLRLFNMSRVDSALLLDRAIAAFLEHPGWECCYQEADSSGFFGDRCPIRHNYELLKSSLVQSRLRSLFELCDYSDLHIPIRRVFLVLANAVLGHPDVRDRLMRPADVATVVHEGTVHKASLFNNVFGGNLKNTRRESLEVFEFLNGFSIGHETSNRIDNILIFGEDDPILQPHFDALLKADDFYGADDSYYAARKRYVEGGEEDSETVTDFWDILVSQRRGLFFKIAGDEEDELRLWELSVFKSAGEFLSKVVAVTRSGRKANRSIVARLVRGLNRVFAGMMVDSDSKLVLAAGVSPFSHARVSLMLEEMVSVTPRLGEKVEVVPDPRTGRPVLLVALGQDLECRLRLTLTRYEFLVRVADGHLPASFSRECYEDITAFKTRLLSKLVERREQAGDDDASYSTFRMLALDVNGNPYDEVVEVAND